MTTTARSIVERAASTLQDEGAVRWTVRDLVRYINDGQNEIIVHRPDAMSRTDVVPLIAGSRQTLPQGAAKLLEVIRNSGTSSRVIRKTTRALIDAQDPNWHAMRPTQDIRHFMYDPREARVFYVYPPAAPGTTVEATYVAFPTPVPIPNPEVPASLVNGDLSIPDILANALADYVMFRAWDKDGEHAANASRAQAYWASFMNALGQELNGTLMASPAAEAKT